MAKYKPYSYKQMVMLSVSLEDQIVPGTLEFAIHTLVEERMDVSRFDENYQNDDTGRLAYDPKVLLKVVLFGYSRGLNSSRKIERACLENVTFMALSCGQYPDHSTIAAFVSSMKDEIVSLFRDVLLVCEEMGLLGGTFFALDGLRLPSNASEQWTGTHAELRRKKERMEAKVKELLEEHATQDKRDEESPNAGIPTGRVHREKQIETLRKKAARIERFLRDNEPTYGPRGKEVTSNLTDNESARMWTSHGPIQGYNGQALIDAKHQVIIHAEAFGHSQDYAHGPPMLDGAKATMRIIGHGEDCFAGKILTADSNYHSTTTIRTCEEMGLDAYIPDRFFRKRDPRFATRRRPRKRFRLENFDYDEACDQYVCPSGKRLKLDARSIHADGMLKRRYVADERDCGGCPAQSRCLTARGGKRKYLMVPIGVEPTHLLRRMAAKVDTPQGRRIYPQRIAIAEPVFANIRAHKRLDRFTLRGKIKVTIQWLLYCMVHNIEKILNYGFT
ncbi:MAG: IS1182 family transposase [Armatimonadetes bacterium]|nr:IS1182 family transposase [Armatimonadota bacterium]